MATMDVIKLAGSEPASFLDVGAAGKNNLNYVKLDGNIGCMVNGVLMKMPFTFLSFKRIRKPAATVSFVATPQLEMSKDQCGVQVIRLRRATKSRITILQSGQRPSCKNCR